MAVIHRGRQDGPAPFETWAGGMEYVMKVTNTTGAVRVLSVDHVGPDTVARIEASRARR